MAFEYDPILHGQIRLFQVTESDSGLVLHLESFLMTDCPKYTALSYAWEDLTFSTQCWCNRATLMISRALYGALSNIVVSEPENWFWADAICINQQNDVEKSTLVASMSDVYKQAEKAIVWLGLSSADSDLALSHISLIVDVAKHHPDLTTRMFSSDEIQGTGLPDTQNAGWTAMYRLFARPWFRRMWVLQEVALASAVEVYCGQNSVNWNWLSVCAFLVCKQPFFHIAVMREYCGTDATLVDTAVEGPLVVFYIYLLRAHKSFLVTGWTILNILLHKQRASEALDYVYGIRALLPAHMQRQIEVDYSPRSKANFRKMHAKLFMLILQEAGDMPRVCFPIKTAHQDLTLPSWCPDWIKKDENWLSGILPAAGSGAGRLPICRQEPKVEADQSLCGTVSQIPDLRSFSAIPAFKIELSDDSRVLAVSGSQFDIIDAILIPEPPSGDLSVDVQEYINRAIQFIEPHPEFRTRLPGIMLADHNWHHSGYYSRFYVNYTGQDILFDLLQTFKAMEALKAENPEDFDITQAMPAHYLHFMLKAFRETRMLARTKYGRYGTVSRTAKAGDSVCIFFNVEPPFILSPTDANGCQEMRGPAYIDGVMDGELFMPAYNSQLQPQTFKLI